MTAVAISPVAVQTFQLGGNPTLGMQLFVYAAGTNTKIVTYTDETAATPQTNPIKTNARGEPQNSLGASVGIWIPPGTAYKLLLASPTDTDPPTSPIWTIDNLLAINAANFVGDAGEGGVAGQVPAPPAGSAATNWVLLANGAWGLVVLPPAGAATILANVTGGTVAPVPVSYATFAAALGGTTSATFALGNDSRFGAVNQAVVVGSKGLTLVDAGVEQYMTGNGSTLTIPANASVAFPIGTTIPVRVPTGVAITIAISSDTLVWIPSGGTGSRTLTGYGYTVLQKVTATQWNTGAGNLS